MEPQQSVTVVVVVVCVVVLWVAISSRKKIPADHAAIVERLGKPLRVVEGPAHAFVLPLVDRIVGPLSLKNQDVTFSDQVLLTSDDMVVTADLSLEFRISDPRSAVYEIADYTDAMHQLAVTAIRHLVAQMTRQEALGEARAMRSAALGQLTRQAPRWGIQVLDCRVEQITAAGPTS